MDGHGAALCCHLTLFWRCSRFKGKIAMQRNSGKAAPAIHCPPRWWSNCQAQTVHVTRLHPAPSRPPRTTATTLRLKTLHNDDAAVHIGIATGEPLRNLRPLSLCKAGLPLLPPTSRAHSHRCHLKCHLQLRQGRYPPRPRPPHRHPPLQLHLLPHPPIHDVLLGNIKRTQLELG